MSHNSTNEARDASDQTQSQRALTVRPTSVDEVLDLSAVMAPMIDHLREPDGYRMMQWSVTSVANGKWAELRMYLRRRPDPACSPCAANT
jgi:hypothetical protein